MKLISWNVNGIRAWIEKEGTVDFLKREDPDVVCFQETKAQREQIETLLHPSLTDTDNFFARYPFHVWNSAEKRGYSGTGVIAKKKPLRVWFGMEKSPLPDEGRIINLEFKDFILVNVYTPNAKPDLSRLPLRYEEWDKTFLKHLKTLERKNLLSYVETSMLRTRKLTSRDQMQTRRLQRVLEVRDSPTKSANDSPIFSTQDLLIPSAISIPQK